MFTVYALHNIVQVPHHKMDQERLWQTKVETCANIFSQPIKFIGPQRRPCRRIDL